MRRRVIAACFFGLVIGIVAACGDDEKPGGPGVTPNPTNEGGPGGGTDSSGLPPVVISPPPPCKGDPAVTDKAIFVDAKTGTEAGPGTLAAPFKTITKGLEAAVKQKATHVYLATGAYNEAITSPTFEAGAPALIIEGGYKVGAQWVRDCDQKDIRKATTITTTTVIGLRLHAPPAGSGLKNFSLSNAPAPTATAGLAGESSVGVWIEGGTGDFTIEGLLLEVTPGGGGGAVSVAPPPDALNCPATPPCATGAEGSAAPDGAPAKGDFAKDTGAWTGTVGATAGNGTIGQNGSSATGGSTATCLACSHNCPAGQTGVCSGTPIARPPTWAGTCGCGGTPGKGGVGGTSGGASIGLLVSGAIKIKSSSSTFISHNGGDAQDGSSGSVGLAGSLGKDGTDFDCETKCDVAATDCDDACGPGTVDPPTAGDGQPAGGAGGKGGNGGRGGGGVGGPSCGVVAANGATFETDTVSTYYFGAAGRSGNGAPAGVAEAIRRSP